MILRFRDVSVSFGARRALDGVSFDAGRGRALALMGPNGAGKTTLLRCLLGLVRFEGRVEVDGLDILENGVEARRRIGYVPQSPAFYDLKAGGWLKFIARLRRAPAAEADRALERVGLSPDAGRPVRVFSGGMRQRLSVAGALLGNPPILLLDEPTANLDPQGRADLIRLLREFRSEGKTLVLSSHRSGEVRDLADRILLLREGRVAAHGSPAEVVPPDRMEIRVEAHEPLEKRRVEDLLRKLDVIPVPSGNGTVNAALDPAWILRVVDGLRAEGVDAGRIRLKPLDDGDAP